MEKETEKKPLDYVKSAFGVILTIALTLIGSTAIHNYWNRPFLEILQRRQLDLSIASKQLPNYYTLFIIKNVGGRSAKAITAEIASSSSFVLHYSGTHLAKKANPITCSGRQRCRYDVPELRKEGVIKLLLESKEKFDASLKMIVGEGGYSFVKQSGRSFFSWWIYLLAALIFGTFVVVAVILHGSMRLVLLEASRIEEQRRNESGEKKKNHESEDSEEFKGNNEESRVSKGNGEVSGVSVTDDKASNPKQADGKQQHKGSKRKKRP